jgi:hypothetical protein
MGRRPLDPGFRPLQGENGASVSLKSGECYLFPRTDKGPSEQLRMGEPQKIGCRCVTITFRGAVGGTAH